MSDKLREALAKGLLETNSPAPNCLTLRFTSQEEMTGAIAALAAEEESGWRLPATIQMPYRKMRADALVAEIMHRAVDKVLRERLPHGDEYGLRRYLSTALTVLFCESGIEVITDADRQAAGLERRNEHGLTPTELVIIENNRLMKMLEPVTITLPFPPSPKDTRAEIEALIKRLEERARGFDARTGTIYTGDIVAAELRWTARELRARLSSMKDDANG